MNYWKVGKDCNFTCSCTVKLIEYQFWIVFKEPKAYCNAFEHIITMFFFRFVPAGCVQARLAYVEAQGELKVPFKDALPTREEQLSSLRNTEEFDILVVGGGATGSGCALDAVTRSMCFFLTKFCNITLLILTASVCLLCRSLLWWFILDFSKILYSH